MALSENFSQLASDTIAELKSDDHDGASSNGHTNGTFATNGGAR